jgi:4-nitrophenyl phosphatase
MRADGAPLPLGKPTYDDCRCPRMRLRGREIQAAAFDIDGTLLLGDRAVHGAAGVEAAARAAGLNVVYLTNFSGAPRAQVADRLVPLGIDVRPEQVYTSASATAAWLAARKLRADGVSRVAMLGTDGLRAEDAEALGF